MDKKINIKILCGGKSSEHEISKISGDTVFANIDKEKYKVEKIVISKDGKIDLKKLINQRTDVVFIALHGKYGEDGRIQGLLESLGIKYTGSGVLASSIGMDKTMFRKVMQTENLPIPKYVVVESVSDFLKILKTFGKPPYFIKPTDQGSSVGASIVWNIKDLKPAIKNANKYSKQVLIDEYITGLELTCGVLGNTHPITLPVTEIHPLKNKFFDYDSKYTESGALEITPARINGKITKEVQRLAIDVYKAIGCRGFARVDFILKDGSNPIILEINTIPGLTPASLLPKSAKVAGMDYTSLVDKIINYAIEK